ncbi:hypothetical protein [Methanorbis furvi]|uniref:Uncharacterized protein n=1 Tax=Methanorbis furvi TaxID=3028299 RepID=A0AAE4MCC0_9EURY|nr:hypothetical protein [Methanocorpusculaceae archaeon Ag1]
MNEIEKTEIRNYLSAAGFLLIATYLLYLAVSLGLNLLTSPGILSAGLALPLIILGVLLLVMRNRDLTAITFLMFGLNLGILYLRPEKVFPDNGILTVGVFFLILAAVLLTSTEKKKYLLFLLPLFIGLELIGGGLGIKSLAIFTAAIGGLLALYFALAVSAERCNLPCGTLLKSDAQTDFKVSGAVLGYLIFGLLLAVDVVYYFTNSVGTPLENVVAVKMMGGIMLCLVAVLLWTLGRMKYTPAMFFLMGVFFFLGSQIANVTVAGDAFVVSEAFYLIAVMMAVVGIITLLKTESRVLPAVMILVTAVSYALIGVFVVSLSPIQGVVALIPTLIAIYLAFAVFSQSKKLPLF